MKIFAIVIAILSSVSLLHGQTPGFGRTAGQPWNLTDGQMDSLCQAQFGSSYRLATWSEVVGYVGQYGLDTFYADSGMTFYRANGWLRGFWSSGRRYFAERHDGNVPSGWLVHASIGNNDIDLGSWSNARPCLCYSEDAGCTPTEGISSNFPPPLTCGGVTGDQFLWSWADDSGDVIALDCIDDDSVGDYFRLSVNGTKVGQCAFTGGLNSWHYTTTIEDCATQDEQIVATKWTTMDDDVEDPKYADGKVDKFVFSWRVGQDVRWEWYKDDQLHQQGEWQGPGGVRNGASFPPPAGPGELLDAAVCDLNFDGVCDTLDQDVFLASMTTCVGDQGYFSPADVDADGCITAFDFEILFGSSFCDGAVVTTYCTAKVNSQGCLPAISASGNSVSLSGTVPFVVTADQLINQQNGMLFYGKLGSAATPFMGGVLCVQPPIVRTPIVNTGGSPGGTDCSGAVSFDFTAWFQGGSDPEILAGQTINAQIWYRDPADALGIGLSDGIEFQVCP